LNLTCTPYADKGGIAKTWLVIPNTGPWRLATLELLKKIENAQLILYPQAGHGFIWQYAEKVASDVDTFLDGGEFEWAEAKL